MYFKSEIKENCVKFNFDLKKNKIGLIKLMFLFFYFLPSIIGNFITYIFNYIINYAMKNYSPGNIMSS